jgi:hypothetical protein
MIRQAAGIGLPLSINSHEPPSDTRLWHAVVLELWFGAWSACDSMGSEILFRKIAAP